MNFYSFYLICFAAASVIHGVHTVLTARLWRHVPKADRGAALEGIVLGAATFLFQFGNLMIGLVGQTGFSHPAWLFGAANIVRDGAFACFPLLFSYMCLRFTSHKIAGIPVVEFGRFLRYPLWPWT